MTDYLAIARECGAMVSSAPGRPDGVSFFAQELSAFAERVRQDERERCAAICNLAAEQGRKTRDELSASELLASAATRGAIFQAEKLAAAMVQQVPERAG
jgi:hypothetical protein